jgi:hypothetical protein
VETSEPRPLPPAPVMRRPTSTPKIFGILNIVFGAFLILAGLCGTFGLFVQRAMAPLITAQQNQMRQSFQANQQAERDAELRKLELAEEAAQSEEAKQTIKVQRQALEATPMPVMPVIPDMSKMYAINDARVITFAVTDMLSAMVLNILMIVSGAGLLRMREWGRKTAIGMAIAKLVRLIVMQACNVFLVLPIVTKQMTEGMQEMMSQMPAGPGGAPPPQFGTQFAMVMGTMMSASAVCVAIVGAVYPILLLWFLTAEDAKAACQAPDLEKKPT